MKCFGKVVCTLLSFTVLSGAVIASMITNQMKLITITDELFVVE